MSAPFSWQHGISYLFQILEEKLFNFSAQKQAGVSMPGRARAKKIGGFGIFEGFSGSIAP
jgi:hypothetical protein